MHIHQIHRNEIRSVQKAHKDKTTNVVIEILRNRMRMFHHHLFSLGIAPCKFHRQ